MTKIHARLKDRRGIRRFVEDALPPEMKDSIREMVSSINKEVTRKVRGAAINVREKS